MSDEVRKKKYVSPEIKLVEMQTVNLMTVSNVKVDSYDGKTDNDINIGKDVDPWDGEEGEY